MLIHIGVGVAASQEKAQTKVEAKEALLRNLPGELFILRKIVCLHVPNAPFFLHFCGNKVYI